jgi:hypothetical protein
MQGVPCLHEKLLAPQEGLFSMEQESKYSGALYLFIQCPWFQLSAVYRGPKKKIGKLNK